MLLEVYFDDFKVTQAKSPVVSADDYYPFGLNFNSYTRENSVKQDFKYNGKELQDELNLGWLDYIARQYDPTIGRFLSIDPAADLMRRFSPYSYAFDNPMRFVDPDGMIPEESTGGGNGDEKKKKEEQQKKEQQKKEDERNRQEALEQARKKGDLVTVYDATKNDNSQAKLKVLAHVLEKTKGDKVGIILNALSNANGTAELAYEISTTNFKVNNFGAGRAIGNAGNALSALTIGNELMNQNYNGALREGGMWALGRVLGPGMLLGQAFVAVGVSQLPEEARDHANNSRAAYATGIKLQNAGRTQEANEYFNRAIREERAAISIVNNLLPTD